ncbi:S-formylglutathione hydrolase [Inhella sp.]|uniref:S-formylglutathione hydrolase n=1 Tax=Inhella sp. TaxID=1921806 RepID=UPI0035B35CED
MEWSPEILGEYRCFGGVQGYYRQASSAIGLPMQYSLYRPPGTPRGLLLCLAGLTCSEETFPIKAGAQRLASELGLALLSPDTSPRGTNIPGQADDWGFGVAAGFYLDATQAPWAPHWRMETHVMQELLPAVQAQLGGVPVSVLGHSMGGHGALTLAQRHPGRFQSLSVIAPISALSQCPWGQKALPAYLGPDEGQWAQHDASALMRAQTAPPFPAGILMDQGEADQFLSDQLKPELFEAACAAVGQPLTLRRHAGYGHGYYFVATVIDDHLRHHAAALGG